MEGLYGPDDTCPIKNNLSPPSNEKVKKKITFCPSSAPSDKNLTSATGGILHPVVVRYIYIYVYSSSPLNGCNVGASEVHVEHDSQIDG